MSWIEAIEAFCETYNIPLEYLADTLKEPKVIPMIRGKAFEFTVMLALRVVLPPDEFAVHKTPMNPQLGFHDEDVSVEHLPTQTNLAVECKLAAKGKYRRFPDGHNEIRVKCMRSRTLGAEMVKRLAPEWGVDEELLQVHNDQYLPQDFDLIITSIGNAFYGTNPKTGLFEWKPKQDGNTFLRFLKGDGENLKDFAFTSLYVARTSDLAITPANGVVCTRGKCANPTHCGFIPNYPIIHFPADSRVPAPPWFSLTEAIELLQMAALEKSR